MSGAGAAAIEAARAALAPIAGLSLHGAGPVRAAPPWAEIAVPQASDWGHKSGAGRELRLAVTIVDEGEEATRAMALAEAAEAAVLAMPAALAGWRIASVAPAGMRALRRPGRGTGGWRIEIMVRLRMLAD